MSNLHNKNKLYINFRSSNEIFNMNKPKLLSIGKSYNIKNLKLNNSNHNISQETYVEENKTRQTESSRKDEIIRVLKERLTVLEKKVKILEKENTENNNISFSKKNKKNNFNTPKLNMKIKLFKNKSNFLELSKKFLTKKNNFSITNLNKTNEEKKNNSRNRNINFLNTINNTDYSITSLSHYKVNNSASKLKLKNNNSMLSYHNSKRKIYLNVLKKKIKNNISIESGKTIPKIPNIKKHKKKSYGNNLEKSEYDCKNDFSKINSSKINYNNNFIILRNDNSLGDIKSKLENIKIRTKNLLEFYSSEKFNNKYNGIFSDVNKTNT